MAYSTATDGYTYSAVNFMGVFSSEEKAIAAFVELAKNSSDYPQDDHHNFEVRPIELDKVEK